MIFSFTDDWSVFPQSDQYVIINHNFTQNPDSFHIIDRRNGSLRPLSFNSNDNGDWYLDEDSNNLYYLGENRRTWMEKSDQKTSVLLLNPSIAFL